MFFIRERSAYERERRVTERRLRMVQRQLAMESLLQSFVICTHYVPANAVRIFDSAELPLALERIAGSVANESQLWLAWTDSRRIWFVVAEVETASNSGQDAPTIKLFFYDDDGRIVSAGRWISHPNGSWDLLPA